jgi:hypothetical protein
VNHDVDLCFRYCVTVDIKAALVLYFFPASNFFQFWKQIKVTGGEVWAIKRVRQQLPFVRVDNLNCSCGGIGGGVIVKKEDIFLC